MALTQSLFRFLPLLAILFHSISCQFPTFHLYTKTSPNTYKTVTAGNLAGNGFVSTKQTKFLIHGFTDAHLRTRLLIVKDAILTREDSNVIVVDWESGAVAPNYLSAANNAKEVGRQLGKFIQTSNINPQLVHCIGHSLGAHACGFAGKTIKINRISGLDPAGPLFKNTAASNRLDKSDAFFVDNIHTDLILGIQQSIGHKDFFPNGGQFQPGCSASKETILINLSDDPKADPISQLSCSHSRAVSFFAESVYSKSTRNCTFKSIPCDNYTNFQNNVCKCTASYGCASMGYDAWSTQESATFYLQTAAAEPFCVS